MCYQLAVLPKRRSGGGRPSAAVCQLAGRTTLLSAECRRLLETRCLSQSQDWSTWVLLPFFPFLPSVPRVRMLLPCFFLVTFRSFGTPMLCSLRKIPARLPVRHVARSTHRSAGYELKIHRHQLCIGYSQLDDRREQIVCMVQFGWQYGTLVLVHFYFSDQTSMHAYMYGRRLHIIDNNHAHWYLFTFIQDLSFIYDTCTCVQFYSSIMICEHV